MSKTLFDKIWEQHVVDSIPDGPDVLYIDRHFIHEVTSPQAFAGLKSRGTKIFRPDRVFATPDHNVPTIDQHLQIQDKLSRLQVDKLTENCEANGIQLFRLTDENHGIVHIIGPELGITQPGTAIPPRTVPLGPLPLVLEPVKWKWCLQASACSSTSRKR